MMAERRSSQPRSKKSARGELEILLVLALVGVAPAAAVARAVRPGEVPAEVGEHETEIAKRVLAQELMALHRNSFIKVILCKTML